MRPAAPPPRALVVAAGLVVLAGVTISAVGAWRTGVSFDEPYHVLRMRNYLHGGWFMLDGDLQNGSPAPWTDQEYVYGPVAMILLHGWSMLLGTDGHGTVSDTATAYAVRHLGVVLFSVVGLAATAALARLMLRSWGWGVVAAATLVAIPTWTGHAMFNVKDIPTAVGYTLATLGGVVLAQAGRRRWLALGAATMVAGIILAVGTRPGISAGVGLTGLVVLALVLLRRQWLKAGVLLLVAVVSMGALAAVYPHVFGNPVKATVKGATQSEHFGGVVGHWDYIPHWLVIQIPELVLPLAALGVLVGLLHVRWNQGRLTTETVAFVLVLLQTAVLPVVAMLRHSYLYNGLRQLIFILPGLALLATATIAMLWTWRGAPSGRVQSVLAGLLTAAALLVPLAVQVQLFPYGYAYSSIPAQYERVAYDLQYTRGNSTDYWRTSVRALAPAVPTEGFIMCTPNLDGVGDFLPHADAMHDNCATDPIGPLAPYAGERRGAPVTDPTRFVAIGTGGPWSGSNCDQLGSVTAPMYFHTITMSVVSDCDLVLDPYPEGGIMLQGVDGEPSYFAIDGWESRYDEQGVGLDADQGVIGFTLSDADRGAALRLSGTGENLTGLALKVNGTSVRVRVAGDTYRLTVPASVASAYGEGRVVLTATGSSQLRLHDLHMAVVEGRDRGAER